MKRLQNIITTQHKPNHLCIYIMNIPNLDTLLIRDEISASIRSFLLDFEKNSGFYFSNFSRSTIFFIFLVLRDFFLEIFSSDEIKNNSVAKLP